MAPLRVLVLSGPNLQLLGTREPEIYGTETLDEIHARLVARGEELRVTVDARQTNHEGGLCDWIEPEAPASVDLPVEGAATLKAAVITVVLHYTTTSPLA